MVARKNNRISLMKKIFTRIIGWCYAIAANEKVFAMAGYSLNVQPGQMLI
jgi:hypothetical protein